MSYVCVAGLVSAAFFTTACSEVSFTGSTPQDSLDTGEPQPAGEAKNSYFFVRRAADILFVIDTSGSMAEEQALLQNGFPSFTSTLNSYSGGTLDWQIAITSTDVANAGTGKQGALVPFSGVAAGTYFLSNAIDVGVANASFQSTVVLGVGGSGDERGIAAARRTAALELNPATSRGFMRTDTPLSVIVLSDEDERGSRNPSSGEFRPFEPFDEPANFVSGIQALDTLSSIPKTITFHSIVTSTQACLDGPGAYMGTTYMQLSTMTGGIIGDICAINQTYQEQLQSLAENIVNEARTYTLPCSNIAPGSTAAYEQELGGALVPVPSTFVAPNKIVLTNPPPVGSLIKAKFTCLD
jgi:hypothetical protein